MKTKLFMGLFSLLILTGCNAKQSTPSSSLPSQDSQENSSTIIGESTTTPSVEQPGVEEQPEQEMILFSKEYKIYINPSVQFTNQYVDKIHNEGQVMNEIAVLLVNRLKSETNLSVKANLDGLSLSQSVKESNAYQPDAHFAIHSNGGGGTGSEVWVSKNSYTFGKIMLDEFNQIHNFRNRGVKYGDGTDASLYEIRNVLAPSALIEILFHDEWTQANFILNNKQEIADSFFKGIVSYFQQVD